jgi:hypothetical protein
LTPTGEVQGIAARHRFIQRGDGHGSRGGAASQIKNSENRSAE